MVCHEAMLGECVVMLVVQCDNFVCMPQCNVIYDFFSRQFVMYVSHFYDLCCCSKQHLRHPHNYVFNPFAI